MKAFNPHQRIKVTKISSERKCKDKKIDEQKQKQIDFCQNNCPYNDCIGNKCKLIKNL